MNISGVVPRHFLPDYKSRSLSTPRPPPLPLYLFLHQLFSSSTKISNPYSTILFFILFSNIFTNSYLLPRQLPWYYIHLPHLRLYQRFMISLFSILNYRPLPPLLLKHQTLQSPVFFHQYFQPYSHPHSDSNNQVCGIYQWQRVSIILCSSLEPPLQSHHYVGLIISHDFLLP